MKIAIMQPYLFPYIGYFQLMKYADVFVIYDDVQYINRGWVNRNRVLNNGQPFLFTMSLKKDSSLLAINERYFSSEFEKEKEKFLKSLSYFYSKAPYYEETISLIQEIFSYNNPNIAQFLTNKLKKVCSYLEIDTSIILSSETNRDRTLRGEDAIIDIVKRLEGREYINPIGGIELYSKDKFCENNIELFFLESKEIQYQQFERETFVPFLSIIDVLMFNSREEAVSLLKQYELK